MPPVTPQEVTVWMQVIAMLIQTGYVSMQQIVAALALVRGQTDADTVAEDDAQLAALRAELARRMEQARIDAGIGPA